MNLIKKILLLIFITSLCSCVDYKINEANKKKEKKYYASSGFALIYNDNLYIEKVVNKKIDNEKIRVMHNVLKPNTPVKIINPVNKVLMSGQLTQGPVVEEFETALKKYIGNPYILTLNSATNIFVVLSKKLIFSSIFGSREIK